MGFRVQGLRFRVSVFKVSGFGSRVSGFGFRVSGFGFRVSSVRNTAFPSVPGCGLRAKGLGCGVDRAALRPRRRKLRSHPERLVPDGLAHPGVVRPVQGSGFRV